MFNMAVAIVIACFGSYRLHLGEYHWAALDFFFALLFLTLFAVKEIKNAFRDHG